MFWEVPKGHFDYSDGPEHSSGTVRNHQEGPISTKNKNKVKVLKLLGYVLGGS